MPSSFFLGAGSDIHSLSLTLLKLRERHSKTDAGDTYGSHRLVWRVAEGFFLPRVFVKIMLGLQLAMCFGAPLLTVPVALARLVCSI